MSVTETRGTPMFDAQNIQKFTSAGARDWMEWSGISLADVVNEDEAPLAKLGAVGFLRAPKGSSSSFEFPYDEVLIVTMGICILRSKDRLITATQGEVLYLPARTPGTFEAVEAVELVYVASSPYGEANREIKASLLAASRYRLEA
jgi:ethanolamine utilization protein EutQ (cupin superfamily)